MNGMSQIDKAQAHARRGTKGIWSLRARRCAKAHASKAQRRLDALLCQSWAQHIDSTAAST